MPFDERLRNPQAETASVTGCSAVPEAVEGMFEIALGHAFARVDTSQQSASGSRLTATRTVPEGEVNFSELPMRFESTCTMRSRSQTSEPRASVADGPSR